MCNIACVDQQLIRICDAYVIIVGVIRDDD